MRDFAVLLWRDVQDLLKQDLTETTEKMIVAQAQRDRLSQKLEQVCAVQYVECPGGWSARGACLTLGEAGWCCLAEFVAAWPLA